MSFAVPRSGFQSRTPSAALPSLTLCQSPTTAVAFEEVISISDWAIAGTAVEVRAMTAAAAIHGFTGSRLFISECSPVVKRAGWIGHAAWPSAVLSYRTGEGGGPRRELLIEAGAKRRRSTRDKIQTSRKNWRFSKEMAGGTNGARAEYHWGTRLFGRIYTITCKAVENARVRAVPVSDFVTKKKMRSANGSRSAFRVSGRSLR